MRNKGIITLIIAIIVILAGVSFYGYNEAVSDMSKDDNINEPREAITTGPVIEVSPDRYDLGTVIYGEVAEHTFAVKNLGDEPLEILRLSTSCGCTKATVAENDKVVASGQSIDMLVTFDPAVHKDNPDLGEVTRIVYIKTNDPKNPEIEVTIAAKVVKDNK